VVVELWFTEIMRDEEDDEDISELDVSDEQPSPTNDRVADDVDVHVHRKSSPSEHSKKLEPVDTNVSAS